MGKSSAKKPAAKKTASADKKPDPGADTPDSQEKSEFVEVTAEGVETQQQAQALIPCQG